MTGEPGDLKPLLAHVAQGRSLTEAQAESAFEIIMSGNATASQIGAFLMALRVRGETVEEIAGAARIMRAKALAVEMLKLPELSPPVPQVSIVPGGASIATALARMIRAAPVISSTVSPRTLSAINSAPICDGVALPLMMISNAASASLSLNARPAATCASKGRRSSGKTVLVGAADIAFCISACSVIRKSQLSPF